MCTAVGYLFGVDVIHTVLLCNQVPGGTQKAINDIITQHNDVVMHIMSNLKSTAFHSL